MAQKNLIVYGKNGKRIGGGAAQLKQIKNYGGWDAYNREVFKAGYEYGWKGASKITRYSLCCACWIRLSHLNALQKIRMMVTWNLKRCCLMCILNLEIIA